MNLHVYGQYFKSLREHRKNVRKICFSEKHYVMGLLHDLDKFLPSIFIPYARYFHGNIVDDSLYDTLSKKDKKSVYRRSDILNKFEKARERHYRYGQYHWEKYVMTFRDYVNDHNIKNKATDQIVSIDGESVVLIEMPCDAVLEMLYDWKAISLIVSDSPQEYYLRNYNTFKLNRKTRQFVESVLGLTDMYEIEYTLVGDGVFWPTLGEFADSSVRERFDEITIKIQQEFNIPDLYDVIISKR